MAKKNNDSVSRTAGEKIISMEERTSKEAGDAEKATRDKIIAMKPEGSKKANTAAKATEGLRASVKTGVPENGNEAVAEKHGQKEAGLSAAGQSRGGGRSMFDVRVCCEHDQRGEQKLFYQRAQIFVWR